MPDKFTDFVDFLEEQAQRVGVDWKLTFDVAHECGWEGDLTITPNCPHDNGLTEGVVLHATDAGPEEVIAILEPRARTFLEQLPLRPVSDLAV